jgi:predicted secreted protein
MQKIFQRKNRKKTFYKHKFSKNLMSITGLAIIYIIIWWIVFFAILPIDVNRNKTVKIEGEDPGSPENPKMLKKFLYCTGITTVIFVIIYLLMKYEYLNLRNIIN